MAAEGTLLYADGELQDTAGADVAAGEIIRLADGRAGINKGLAAATTGDAIVYAMNGVFRVPSASATLFSQGDPVFWDASASLAVPAAADLDGSADHYLGTAALAKVNGATVVTVDLNAGFQRLRPFVFEFDTETDTSVRTLIPSYMNPTGLRILSITGFVSEVFAGASEDQGIVTVKDTEASPNTLCTLTPSNAGADALNDVIQGAAQANALISATGTLGTVVAAGKGVTGTVTQAVSGSGAAGKMKVYVLALPLA